MDNTAELDQMAEDRSMTAVHAALPALTVMVDKQLRLHRQAVKLKMDAGEMTGEQAIAAWAAHIVLETFIEGVWAKVRTHAAGLNRVVSSARLSLRPPAGPEAA